MQIQHISARINAIIIGTPVYHLLAHSQWLNRMRVTICRRYENLLKKMKALSKDSFKIADEAAQSTVTCCKHFRRGDLREAWYGGNNCYQIDQIFHTPIPYNARFQEHCYHLTMTFAMWILCHRQIASVR